MNELFNRLLHYVVDKVSRLHEYILNLNDVYQLSLNDKELHFIIFGLCGLVLLIILVPFIKWLVKKNLVTLIAWIFVFTILIVMTFMVEIGQKVTGTGNMDFKDMLAGIGGFVVISVVYMIVKKVIATFKQNA